MTIETTTDSETWGEWRAEVELEDVYYRFDYTRIWEPEEHGNTVGLRFESDEGVVLYPVLKVPLDPIEGGDGRIDVRTAYDFGGPYAVGDDPAALQEQFREAFAALADEWGVVTEFARLHPLRHEELPEESEFHAENLVVDLTEGYEHVHDAYKSSFARNVRKAERNDLVVEIDEDPDERAREAFSTLYLDTMEKVDADPFYFFSEQTLDALMDLPEMATVNVWTDDAICASALVLRSENDLFYYLGASDRDYLDLRPNNILFDRIIRHGAERTYDRLHLGGGSEGLRRFKKQMATGGVDYHLLKRIHDEPAYRAVCEANDLDPDDDAFPAYRDRLLELAD